MEIFAFIIVIGFYMSIGFLVHLFFYWVFRNTGIRGDTKNQRLNYYLPVYDIFETHKIVIYSSPEKVFNAIHNLDMRKSKVINILVSLRSFFHPLDSNKEPNNKKPISIGQLTEGNEFMFLLEEVDNQEVVMGSVGKFWRLKPTLIQLSNATDFISFNKLSYSKVAWNLFIERNDDESVTLSTETRILCLGWGAKFLFRLYWAIIRPYSGWIRVEMLKIIKAQAESYKVS